MTTYALDELRSRFHASLCRRALGYRETRPDVPNIADDSSRVSVAIARSLLEQIPFDPCPTPPTAQGAGSAFAECAREFLDAALEALSAVRPWDYELSTSQKKIGIGAYAQYAHLAELRTLIADNQALRAWLGTDYMVTPDLVVVRLPLRDAALNAARSVVSPGSSGRLSPARYSSADAEAKLLHASISCKWRIRSDRAQNSRLEALNLLRNRKGRAPHICSLTIEPLPSRIECVAAGTGDIDCVYHAALNELAIATEEYGTASEKRSLEAMLQGRRLRDISDLPLDLLL